MHRARWRAYLWLELCATESIEDVRQLAAFNALTAGSCADAAFAKEVNQFVHHMFMYAYHRRSNYFCCVRVRQIQGEAAAIWHEATNGGSQRRAPILPSDAADRETQRIYKVLMKFQRNQFAFCGGSGDSPEVNASAVYLFSSKLNHSCSPNVAMKPKMDLEAAKPTNSGAPLPAGAGHVVARTTVDVPPGAGLTFNYGPPQLLEWPLDQRRAYLLAKHGFRCMCLRCESEEAAAPLALSDGIQCLSKSDEVQSSTGLHESDVANVGTYSADDGMASRPLRVST